MVVDVTVALAVAAAQVSVRLFADRLSEGVAEVLATLTVVVEVQPLVAPVTIKV